VNLSQAVDYIARFGRCPLDEELRNANLRRRPLVDLEESDLDCLAERSENAIFRPLERW